MSQDPRIQQFANDFLGETTGGFAIDGFSENDPGPAWSPNDGAPRPPQVPTPAAPMIPMRLEYPEPSPLIPQGPPTTIPEVSAGDLQLPMPAIYDLWVGDRQAEFKGQGVELTVQEHAAVASIVLRAISRRVQGQMREVAAAVPRQVRVKREAQVAEAPKKRGRPRKDASASNPG